MFSDTKRIRLPNGLTLLTHQMPGAEVAALHFCVQAGYFCEEDSEVGLAHLLEHMYFKGSDRFPVPGTIGVRMKSLGGMVNATTSYDQTNYFCELPAENLVPAFEILADAFVAPIFPADELKKECEVVIEEFNRKLDSPASYSQEKLIQLAFTKHRMKRWRIGTPEQLRSYTRDNLFDYFHRYYQPQNMVVTVTGKFDKAEIQNRLELISAMKYEELRKDFGPAEPPQTELRYMKLYGEATQSYLHFGFHVPGVLRKDGPALEVLSYLLGTGRSSRLHRSVVEHKRSASSVSCGYAAYEDVGLFLISATTRAADIRAAGHDIWSVIRDLITKGVSSAEMNKVKTKLRLHHAMQMQEALGMAQILSYYEAYGGYERMEEYIDDMQKTESEALIDVAKEYLHLGNMSALEFVNRDVSSLSAEDYSKKLQPKDLRQSEQPQIHSGKVTFILQPDLRFPFVAGGIFFRGGRSEESRQNAGITHLLLRNVLKGTSRFTADEIAFRFDNLGNSPRAHCTRDYCGFILETLPETFGEAWELLIHCLTSCSFPEKELETEKQKITAAIRRNLDDNFVRPFQLCHQAFYGDHPYGFPETGFEETIGMLTTDNLENWKGRLFDPVRTVISVCGSFDPDVLLPRLETAAAVLPASGEVLKMPESLSFPAAREKTEERPKKQTAFAIGFPAVAATDPGLHTFEALQQILGGMGGRLFLNLRSKKSLAYTVYASAACAFTSGTFLTYIAGEAAKEAKAREEMWKELVRLKEEPVSEEELDRARNGLIGNYTLGTQTASARVGEAIHNYLLCRPMPFAEHYRDLVRMVTAESILQTSRTCFVEEHSTIGIVRGTTEMTQAEKLVPA